MYLHLGDNATVLGKYVIGVFDLETSTTAKDTRDFLHDVQINNQVCDICDDIPKAFVLYCENSDKRVYITQIASDTLRKRVNI
ncbi:MAG: DUF370 domain-containing protein [Oscillospiraceae bacterium]|nr:DUF370 domain-containing protein [Oscillospiraceae bacterium]